MFSVVPVLNTEEEEEELFSYFPTKTYVVGTQKCRFYETALLSTQTFNVKIDGQENIQTFTLKSFDVS